MTRPDWRHAYIHRLNIATLHSFHFQHNICIHTHLVWFFGHYRWIGYFMDKFNNFFGVLLKSKKTLKRKKTPLILFTLQFICKKTETMPGRKNCLTKYLILFGEWQRERHTKTWIRFIHIYIRYYFFSFIHSFHDHQGRLLYMNVPHPYFFYWFKHLWFVMQYCHSHSGISQ